MHIEKELVNIGRPSLAPSLWSLDSGLQDRENCPKGLIRFWEHVMH